MNIFYTFKVMNCIEVEKYISAFVDKDFTGLTYREIDQLDRYIHRCPHCFDEMLLELATKLCVEKHRKMISCPSNTFAEIQTYLYHMYKSDQVHDQL
jgi:hypothetical protein